MGGTDEWRVRLHPHVITHYELDDVSPGGPPRVYTFAEPETLEAMQSDVSALARQAT